MNIYFAGAIRAGRQDAEIYKAMIECLRSFGDVLTEHVGDPALSEKAMTGRMTGLFMTATWPGWNPVIAWWPR